MQKCNGQSGQMQRWGLGRRNLEPAHSLSSLLFSNMHLWAQLAKPATWWSFHVLKIPIFYSPVQIIHVLSNCSELLSVNYLNCLWGTKSSVREISIQSRTLNVSVPMNNALSSWVSTWNMKPQQWAHQGFTGKYVHSQPPEPHNGFCCVAIGGEGGKEEGGIQGNNVYCFSQRT